MRYISYRQSNQNGGWRAYQTIVRRRRKQKALGASILKIAGMILMVAGAGYGLIHVGHLVVSDTSALISEKKERRVSQADFKAVLTHVIDPKDFLNLREPQFVVEIDGKSYRVETSIDPRIQHPLLSEMAEVTSRERYRSRYIGVVVMEAATGRVLAMVSFDSQDPSHNTCLDGQFPAASIFKIVTAAAAMDGKGLTADSPIQFNGQKHTLYRAQLKAGQNRYSHTLSLKDSFAQSVNPVFGKLGFELLGKRMLEDFGSRFGFNRPIDFDLPVSASHLAIGEDFFEQAEIASGFNKQTTISPLHGAVMAATVLNGGAFKAPSVVDRILGPRDRAVYQRSDTASPEQVISPEASRALQEMMLATISKGTGRKVFRHVSRDAVLKELAIGGKTGSINNNPRYDWFVGFARDPGTGKTIVVSSVVAHEDYIGRRAGEYAITAMSAYFSDDPDMARKDSQDPKG